MAHPVRSAIAFALVLSIPLGLVACSDNSGAKAAKGCRTISGSKVTLVARNVAWDTDCLEAPPGTIRFTIVNKDSGVSHNLRVTGNGVNAHTRLQPGPITQTLSVSLSKPGRYTYVCDIHANMEGTLTVK